MRRQLLHELIDMLPVAGLGEALELLADLAAFHTRPAEPVAPPPPPVVVAGRVVGGYVRPIPEPADE